MHPYPKTSSLVEITQKAFRTTALPDQLYAELKVRILTGALKPGMRLNEKDLCAEFDISRTPLRESINRLINEKLVEPQPNRGYHVTPLRVDDFRKLNEVRRVIEPQAAALAASRADAATIRKLRDTAVLPGYDEHDEDGFRAYARQNCLFHLALVQATGNQLLEELVMDALDKYQRPAFLGIGRQRDADNPSREHLAIVDAVEAHDAMKAQLIMHQHIYTGEDRVAKALIDAGVR